MAVTVSGGLMQLNCFANTWKPGISNSSLILRASFIRCLVMRERAWEREQRVSYASRRSACGGNSASSAGQEWRSRSPGEARRLWNSCSLRGGLADSHLGRKMEPGDGCGAVEARRGWAGQGALLGAHWWKLPRAERCFPTDGRWWPPHFKKHFGLNE